MKKKAYRLAQVVLLGVMAFALVHIVDYYRSDAEFDARQVHLAEFAPQSEMDREDAVSASADAGQTTKRLTQEASLSEEDSQAQAFVNLQAVYPQVVAWIQVPGTAIDYPVVQGADNAFYLDHDFRGEYHPFGAIYLEAENLADFSDQNTVIYGHGVQTGRQFGDLDRYRDPDFAAAHSEVWVRRDDGLHPYKVVAFYEALPDENFRSPVYGEEEWTDFINRVAERNLLSFPLPDRDEQILTLQTCKTDEVRWVLHAVKKI